MIGQIVRKEILSNLSSHTFIIICIFCSAIILLSIYTGLRSLRDQVAEYRQTEILNRQILSEQTTYRSIDGLGVKLSKPVEVLGTIVTGLENVMGRHTVVNQSITPTLTGSKIEGNPIFAIFGELDLAFITKTVLSLLAILFTYNSISGEKEDGTLRLTLSYSVPRDSIIFGKMIGGFFCLVIPMGVPLVFGISLITLSPDFHLTGADWVRILLILGVFLLYLSVFFSLGMFVSARTSRSAISFLVLLLLWVIWVLIVPKGSVIIASQFIKVPSIQEYRIREAQSRRQLWQEYNPAIKKIYQKTPPPKVSKIDPSLPKIKRDAIMTDAKKALVEWQEKLSAVHRELNTQREAEWEAERIQMEQKFNRKKENLAKLAVTLSRFSPASAMTYASMGLAGTGIESRDQFLSLAMEFKENYSSYIKLKIQEELRQRNRNVVNKIKSNTSVRISFSSSFSDDNKPVDIDGMPVFQYQEEPLSDVLEKIAIDILLLSLLTIAFFTGAYVSFIKYDPR